MSLTNSKGLERNYSDLGKYLLCRSLGRRSIHPQDWDADKRDIERHAVYNDLPYITIDPKAKTTTETKRQAESLFAKIAPALGPRKLGEKRRYFISLFHAAKKAMQGSGCIRYSRDLKSEKRIHLKVIESAIKAGFFLEHRSPPGSPKMSRLLTLNPIEEHAIYDPWEFDVEATKWFVSLRDRKTKEELTVDASLPIVARTQEKLELINRINSEYKIQYEPWNFWRGDYVGTRQLRPVHCAVFNGDFQSGGRLVTGEYGHQNLRKQERKTISFDGEPCVEYDYGGMHPRLLFHREGIPFGGDPYALWENTTEPLRLMAKLLINAAINARTRQGAISACNQSMNTRKKDGEQKTGNALADAQRLYAASKKTGLKFADIYDLAERKHRRISKYFGTDYGVKLMRMDSSIALSILHHFAKRGCPCLSVHDSFIVPTSQKHELKRVMQEFYHAETGFSPVIKATENSPVFCDF